MTRAAADTMADPGSTSDAALDAAILASVRLAEDSVRRTLPQGWIPDRLKLRRLDVTRARIAAQYRVQVHGDLRDAVVVMGPADQASRLVASVKGRALSRLVAQRTAPCPPVCLDETSGALVQWLPFDPALPALALSADRFVNRLRRAGVPVDAGAAVTPLAYRLERRAVLAVGNHVAKLYTSSAKARRSEDTLRRVQAVLGDRTAPLTAAIPDLMLTVQARCAGVRPDASTVAPLAGDLLAALHRGPTAGLAVRGSEAALAKAARRIALLRGLDPGGFERARRLLDALVATRPRGEDLVCAHGDFNAGQLLLDGQRVAIIDVDELCAAPPAVDLARFAAQSGGGGRPGGLDAADELLSRLVSGYGHRPADLDWYLATFLLRRCAHPFTRQRNDWRTRTAAILAETEVVIDRLRHRRPGSNPLIP